MAYDFSKTADGSVQVSQGGKIVSTGTADNAALNYGYDPKVVTAEPGVISSQQGVSTINQKTGTLSNLTATAPTAVTTPTPAATTTPSATTPTSTPTSVQTKVTLLNPLTGQTQSFDNAELNQSAIQGLIGVGYHPTDVSSNGTVPSWLTASSTGKPDVSTTPMGKAQAAVDQAATDLKTQTDNLSKYTVSDADLKAQTDAITAQWNARIEDMKSINAAREANINTTGIRLGSQYAGGAGGVFGGIVSEEERQGVVRIGDLESQKQQAISAAKSAAQSQNWQVFSKQVDLAEKAYNDKISALKDLQTATAAQNKLISDQLQAQNTADAKVKADLTKSIQDVLTSATKNGLTDPAAIQAIQNAPDVASAMKAAGDYLQEGSGIVGEYLYYQKQAKAAGTVPMDFNAYQNADANRKAKATSTYMGGVAPATLSKITTIADQFKSEQTVQQYQTVSQALQAFKTAGDSPTDDIQRIYIFAKTMDPNSSVREGEYSTVQQYAQAYLTGLGIKLDRLVNNDGFLTEDARNKMEATLENKAKPIVNSYESIRNSYSSRINKISGNKDGSEYLTDYSTPSGDELSTVDAQAEANLTTNLNAIKTSQPQLYLAASKMFTSVNPDTGQPYSASDILQAFPELKK